MLEDRRNGVHEALGIVEEFVQPPGAAVAETAATASSWKV
jgi:hypothetical protein